MSDANSHDDPGGRSPVRSVRVPVELCAGRVRLSIGELMQLAPGSEIELDRLVGEPMELTADSRVLALVEPLGDDDQVKVRLVGAPTDEDDGSAR